MYEKIWRLSGKANSTHQNTTQKTKDLETRISQQNRGKGWAVPAPLLAPIVLLWTKSCIKSRRKNCGILTVIKGIYQWLSVRKVERYQRGNQKPRIEGQKIQWPKGQAMIYKILHKKLMIEQHEPHFIHRVNSDATKEEAVPTPLVPLVMSLILSISHEESENLPKLWL